MTGKGPLEVQQNHETSIFFTILPCLSAICNSVNPGLSYDTNETALREAFIQHGNIIEVRVICDHVTAKSRGYGFVRFSSEDAAASALKQLDGQLLDNRNIRVHYANKQ